MSTFSTWRLLLLLLCAGCQSEQKQDEQPPEQTTAQKPAPPAHRLPYQARLVTDLVLPADTLPTKDVAIPEPLRQRFDQLVDQYVLKGLDSANYSTALSGIRHDAQLMLIEKNLFLCVLHLTSSEQDRFLSFLYNAKTDRPSSEEFVWPATYYRETTEPILSRPYVYVKTDSLVIREKKRDGSYNGLASNFFTYSILPVLHYQKTKPF